MRHTAKSRYVGEMDILYASITISIVLLEAPCRWL